MNEQIVATIAELLLAGILLLVFFGPTSTAWTLFILRWRETGQFPLCGRDRRPAPWGIATAILLLFAVFVATNLAVDFIHCISARHGKETDENLFTADSNLPAERPIEELIDEPFTPTADTPFTIPHTNTIIADDNDEPVDDMSDLRPAAPQHPAIVAMQNDPALAPAMFFVAVVTAPIGEEILFRLLLLGGLEATFLRLLATRRIPLRRVYPVGIALSVALVAAIFAALHFRSGSTTPETPLSWPQLVVPSTVMMFTAMAALVILRTVFGATLADFGLDPGPGGRLWRQDVRTGLVAALLVIVPLFIIQGTVNFTFMRLGWSIAPDPFTIFPLAIVLGFLFIRTRRLLPCIVLHFCLNALSMSIALLGTLYS